MARIQCALIILKHPIDTFTPEAMQLVVSNPNDMAVFEEMSVSAFVIMKRSTEC